MVNVHNILKYDRTKILDLKDNLNIMFDDGVSVYDASYKKVIMFRYILDFISRYDISITSDLWIDNNAKNGLFTSGTYLNIYSNIFKTIVKRQIQLEQSNSIMHPLLIDMYTAITRVNAVLVSKFANYSVSTSILDILEIQYNKELLDALIVSNEKKSVPAVNETYNVVDKIMKYEEYKYNPINLFYTSGIVSIDQIKQLLGSRGFITEIDSKVFSVPMTNSFALGFKNPYEAAIESRSGAKALFLYSKAIQDSEYMSRELQLVTMVIEGIYLGDCGNPSYIKYFVKPKEYDNDGKEVYNGDIKLLIGKHYKIDDDSPESIIDGTEEHLAGKFILLRFAASCGLKHKNKICSACAGELTETVFSHQNLGNLSTVNLTSKLSQSLLSAKHLLKSASASTTSLPAVAKKHFLIKNSGPYINNVFFKANVINKKVKKVYLKIKQSEAWGLSSIMDIKDLFSINIAKITRLSELVLTTDPEDASSDITLPVKAGAKYAHLTMYALSHIINHGYDVFDEEYFIIDINDFSTASPLFKYDDVEFDFSALGKEVKRLLKTRSYKYVNDKIRSEYTADVLVQRLFDLINKKLNINITILEVIAYAFTVQNLNELNYDLGRNATTKNIVGFKEAINFRSIGASYGWDALQQKILNPTLYIADNKPDHPLDTIFAPNEVVNKFLKEPANR